MVDESMEYDLVIVGGGPAGLSAAIHYAQLATRHQLPIRVCVLEKGSEIGAHIISGAVFEPRALNELFPDWQKRGAPLHTPVTQDVFQLLTARRAITLPTPPGFRNTGNYIISLSALCRWLANEAQALGVDIFPGYAATQALFDAEGSVVGVATNPVGIDKNGQKKPNYQPGMELRARYTLLAEGCRGSLTKQLSEQLQLQKQSDPQTYGIGVKELWEIDPSKHQAGKTIHTVGWPLDRRCYGGSFLLQMEPSLLSIGLIIGLDYQNTYLDPFEELQRFKHHPSIKPLLEGGRRIEYGARALNEGGFQSIPTLAFPGGLLIGCAAGFMNVAKLKGNHTAMKSGMLAAAAVFEALQFEKDKISQANVMKDQVIKNQIIKDKTLQDQDQKIKEQVIKVQEIKEQEIKDQVIKIQEIKVQEIKEQEIKEQVIKVQEIKEQEIKEQAVKNKVMKDESLQDEKDKKDKKVHQEKQDQQDKAPKILSSYTKSLQESWVWPELKKARNIRPAFRFGLWLGLAYAALDTYIFRGKAPWTFHFGSDYSQLKEAKYCRAIQYPKPDGKISFDKLSSLQFSNTNHADNQPAHLILKDPKLAIQVNWTLYASPEQRYCPANVYEIIQDQDGNVKLQISAQNCLHCKTCDIKDPRQNIDWIPPEGGGGPNYSYM